MSAAFALAFCLSITAAASFFSYKMIKADENARFERVAQSVAEAIETRIRIYENALLATRGLFVASENVKREEFRDFVEGFRLHDRFSGIQGIGYTVRLRADQVGAHEKQVRATGFPDYRVWPRTAAQDAYSIVFLEPFNWRNRRAFGFDMSSEPVRRLAMETARDTGLPQITGKLTLVQETNADTQPGFLIYVPIYKRGQPVSTVQERREALRGFVYSPFRTGDLFRQISIEVRNNNPRVRLMIYDGTSAEDDRILFDSAAETATIEDDATEPRYADDSLIQVAGSRWLLSMSSMPGFEVQSSRTLPLSVAILGTIISVLIFFVLRFATRLNEKLFEALTLKLRSESEILRARHAAEDANRAKTRFLANMSHEIRTPLGVIIGFADLALDPGVNREELRSYLNSIKRNGQQLAGLVGEILDITKIEADKIEIERLRFPFQTLLEDVISSLDLRAREKGIRLIWDQSHPLPEMVTTDPTRLRQILFNLISNAIKFTDRGEVRVTPRSTSELVLGNPCEIEVKIEDTGIGISEEQRERLFVAFSQADTSMTRRFGGSGLGLSLARQLARALGGDVELKKSEAENGSVFVIRIPVGRYEGPSKKLDRESTEVSSKTEKSPSKKPLRGQKLLLVEDSPDNQVLMSRYLRSAGADLDIASDGQEALEKASGSEYDLVLMDIQMPKLDGYEATRQMRERGFKSPIIALTAHALREERERALRSGFNGYLTKPVTRSALIDGILEASAVN